MFKNYLKIAIRNLWRHKGFSFINLFGLSVGLTCCLLIALFILNELSYDKYHANANRIYRVTRDFVNPDGSDALHLGSIAPPFGPLLKNYFSDAEEVVRIMQNRATISLNQEKTFNEVDVFFAEPGFFKVFTAPVISGNPATALSEPNTIMLTEEMAGKYFPQQNPLGQTLRLNSELNLKVTGVFKEFPANSHFHPNFLVSFVTLADSAVYGRQELQTNYGRNNFTTYMLFPENYPVEKVSAQFPAFLDKSIPYDNNKPSSWTHLYLQKLTDIHLYSHLDTELEENGDINTVYLFAAVALFILLIAGINFMNLSTARSSLRAKEIGVRKVMGATQPNLIIQFLSESLLFALLAVVLALLFTRMLLPVMNSFIGKELSFTLQNSWLLSLGMLGLALLVGLVAGAYPALFLSSFQPVKVLKGKLNVGSSSISLRQVLVVLQFSVSVVLLVCTSVVYKQLSYLKNKTLGFDKEHIITLPYTSQLSPNYEAFRTELLANPAVKEAARSVGVPSDRLLNSEGETGIQSGDSIKESGVSFQYLGIDHYFSDTYKIKLLAGRNFSEQYPTDDSLAFMLNESGAKLLGLKNPQEGIGKTISYGERRGKLVGVLQDFHFESMHEEIKPLLFMIPDGRRFRDLSVKLTGNNLKAGLAHIEKTWQQFLPDIPYEYNFLDESFGRLYEAEQKQGKLFTIFASMAILIASLGLFGLASFATEQRTKEIGIRKVLGASVSGIVGMLSKDFLKLVLIANIIAWPLAWYGMHKWLQDFAYRTDISWWIFGAASCLALAIALVTVSFQAVKAAVANPVQALRSE